MSKNKKTEDMSTKELHSLTNEQIDTSEKVIVPVAVVPDTVRIDFEDRKFAFLNSVSSGMSVKDALIKYKFNQPEIKKLRGE